MSFKCLGIIYLSLLSLPATNFGLRGVGFIWQMLMICPLYVTGRKRVCTVVYGGVHLLNSCKCSCLQTNSLPLSEHPPPPRSPGKLRFGINSLLTQPGVSTRINITFSKHFFYKLCFVWSRLAINWLPFLIMLLLTIPFYFFARSDCFFATLLKFHSSCPVAVLYTDMHSYTRTHARTTVKQTNGETMDNLR